MYNYLGLIGGMYINHYNDNLFNKYEDYNYDSLEKKIVNNDVTIQNNIGTPNIIVILSESFFDVSLLDENIVFDKDITHNFNELKNDGYLVDLISCSYGGMTVNVTYQLLTGSNMSIYNNGYIPFMKLFKDTNDYPSIVKELKNNGYKISEYLANDSYQVSKEFKKIGFDKYELIVSNNVKGYYISDDYMADFIIDEIEENNDKEFMLFQTMQNHMDYLVTKYPKYDISIKSSNLSTKANNLLLSYTQGIYDADKMLKKVYDYINTIDKDTILIFFGDHLPYLSDYDNVDELKKLDYFSTNDELINLYRKYNTQALILSNYDLSLNINSNLSTDNLLLSIINQMDIEVSDYYKYLYGLIDYLPSYNKYVYVDKNGKINYTKNLNSEEKSIFELKNALTYKKYIKE